jgi:hypothetical protein
MTRLGILLVCVAGATVLMWRAAFLDNYHQLQWEDGAFFSWNAHQINSVRDCFTQRGNWPGLYRPLTTNLYYYIGGKLWNQRIEVYHWINIVMVVINSLLLYRLSENFMDGWYAIIPALLFSTRTAMIECVLHSCEFQGLLYVCLTILSADLFIRHHTWASAVTFALALLSKESAVVLPALLIAYGWLFERFSLRYLLHPVIAVVWAVLFHWLVSGTTGNIYDFGLFNLLRNYAAYALVFSNWLAQGDLVMPAYVAGLSALASVRLGMALLIAGAAVMFWARRLPAVTFGLLWFLIATSPYVIFDNRLFMRYANLGHAGLALSAGALVALLG